MSELLNKQPIGVSLELAQLLESINIQVEAAKILAKKECSNAVEKVDQLTDYAVISPVCYTVFHEYYDNGSNWKQLCSSLEKVLSALIEVDKYVDDLN